MTTNHPWTQVKKKKKSPSTQLEIPTLLQGTVGLRENKNQGIKMGGPDHICQENNTH